MNAHDIFIAAGVGALSALCFDYLFWVVIANLDDKFKESKRRANEAKSLRRQIRNGRTPRGL